MKTMCGMQLADTKKVLDLIKIMGFNKIVDNLANRHILCMMAW